MIRCYSSVVIVPLSAGPSNVPLPLWVAFPCRDTVHLHVPTLVTVWYYHSNPPDSEEVRRMRLFFKENSATLITFIKMPHDEMQKFAAKEKHPFYKSYQKASEVEKQKIKALIHVSTDYTPNQYWFNMVFLRTIFFTTFWFFGLVIQGVVNLVRRRSIVK